MTKLGETERAIVEELVYGLGWDLASAWEALDSGEYEEVIDLVAEGSWAPWAAASHIDRSERVR